MDNELFLKRLREFAEIKQAKVPTSGGIRQAKEPDTVYRGGMEIPIPVKDNPTLTYVIKKLKPITKTCEDCGRCVKDRKVTKGVYAYPVKHWRSHCSACNQVWNPETGQFDIENRSAQSHFTSLLRKQDK